MPDKTTKPEFHRQDRAYMLVPHDPAWEQEYKRQATQLREILGDIIIQIEHVGSTALPDIVAKPQIDILVKVRDLDEVRQRIPDLESRGYTSRGDFTATREEYFTVDAPDGARLVSIHMMGKDNKEAGDMIILRDYLIANETDRRLYERTKLALKGAHPDSYNAYSRDKRLVIDEIKRRASRWAQR